ncbi:MAG: nicotinamide-nucleotide amidohydrolase family protein [Phycisphaerales bacterium]|nr:nicotinamide-nucleotide amidohydrolase family protein [Phycisphaerales bacterium]
MTFTHDSAAIVSIGDELAIGQTLDTNSKWLAERLTERGVRVAEHVTIPDSAADTRDLVVRLAGRVRLVVITGGLGPTADDLTRQGLAEAMGEELVEDDAGLAHIRSICVARGREMTAALRSQALRPRSAAGLHNRTGTAPGIWATVRAGGGAVADVACLPGPPNEMKPMWEHEVAPRLRPPAGRVVATRVLHTLGLGESDVAARLGDLMRRDAATLVGTTASGGVVSVRIRREGEQAASAAAVDEAERACREALGPFGFADGRGGGARGAGGSGGTGVSGGTGGIAAAVIGLLRQRGERLTAAESCTGGLLASMLTEVPGSSDVFDGSWVAYANRVKTAELGVEEGLIAARGAVSEEVARAMAEGARRRAGAAHALAITGIAGPSGAAPGKPVGTVFIGLASALGCEVRRLSIPGDRSAVRDRSAKLALGLLRFRLIGAEVPRVLWQVAADGSPLGA